MLMYNANNNTKIKEISNNTEHQEAANIKKIGKRSETFRSHIVVRDEKDVSVFVETLCETLTESAKEGRSFSKVMLKVNQMLTEDKTLNITPVVSHTLTKNLYFHLTQHKNYETELKSKKGEPIIGK